MKISLDDQIQQRPLAQKKGNLWFIEIFQKKWDELNLSKLSLAVWQWAHEQEVHLEMRLSQSGVTPRPANTQETPPIQPSYSIHITYLLPQRPQPAERNIRRGLGKRKLSRKIKKFSLKMICGEDESHQTCQEPVQPPKKGIFFLNNILILYIYF